MKKILKFLIQSGVDSFKFAFLYMIASTFVSFVRRGLDVFRDINLKVILLDYIHVVFIVFIILILIQPFKYIRMKNKVIVTDHMDDKKSKPLFSKFTKILMIFIGIPIFSLMLSTYIIRFFQQFEISISSTSIFFFCTLISWLFGVYKCKTDYFKKTDNWS
jgi:hypothetical protein